MLCNVMYKSFLESIDVYPKGWWSITIGNTHHYRWTIRPWKDDAWEDFVLYIDNDNSPVYLPVPGASGHGYDAFCHIMESLLKKGSPWQDYRRSGGDMF